MVLNGKNTFVLRVSLAVAAIMLVGGGALYAYLTVQRFETPATLLVFLGAGLVILKNLFAELAQTQEASKAADAATDAAEKAVSADVKVDAAMESLRLIQGALETGKENMIDVNARFDQLETLIIERTKNDGKSNGD